MNQKKVFKGLAAATVMFSLIFGGFAYSEPQLTLAASKTDDIIVTQVVTGEISISHRLM